MEDDNSSWSFLDTLITSEDVDDIEVMMRSTRMLMFTLCNPQPVQLSVETAHVQAALQFYFGKDVQAQEMTVVNMDPLTKAICPYFRVVYSVNQDGFPVNYLLENFLMRVNRSVSSGPFVRCERAIVFGLMEFGITNNVVDVPYEYSLLLWSDRVYNPWEGMSRMALPEIEVPLRKSCVRCSAGHMGCNHVMPCRRCRDDDKVCEPMYTAELKQLAINTQKAFLDGVYTPCLAARFMLHHQSEAICKKPLLSRGDAMHANTYMFHHIKGSMLDGHFNWVDRDVGTALPPQIQDCIKDCDLWKVEWFSTGFFGMVTSDMYAREIIKKEEVMAFSKKFKVAPKFIDNCGLLDDTCFKWWLETLLVPGVVHDVQKWIVGNVFEVGTAVPTHCCYFRAEGRIVKVHIKMMTIMSHSDRFITVTTMCRSDIRVMG